MTVVPLAGKVLLSFFRISSFAPDRAAPVAVVRCSEIWIQRQHLDPVVPLQSVTKHCCASVIENKKKGQALEEGEHQSKLRIFLSKSSN